MDCAGPDYVVSASQVLVKREEEGLRFGAGVSSDLLHHLAVCFILYQAMVAT